MRKSAQVLATVVTHTWHLDLFFCSFPHHLRTSWSTSTAPILMRALTGIYPPVAHEKRVFHGVLARVAPVFGR